MRLLHLADLHLDTAFAGRTPELRMRLRDGLGRALERAVSTALDLQVDAVLVAGDLLDGERLSYPTERLLLEQLGRLRDGGIPVVYATGNHDPGTPGGPVARIPWPGNVHLISGPDPVRIEIARSGEAVGFVTGAGHPSSSWGEDLSRAFPRPEGRLPEAGLLHTQVGGAPGSEAHHRYAPSDLGALARAGYHYWALGHVHLRQALSDSPPIHYPGNLQGRSPRETGAKGGLFVDLANPELPEVEFVELAPIRWETLRIEGLDEVERAEEVVRRAEAEWRRTREEDPGLPGAEWLVRVELAGPSDLFPALSREEEREGIADALRAGLDLLDVEVRIGDLRPRRRIEPHLDRQDVLGEALRLLRDLARDEKRSPAEELGIGSEDLAGFDPREHESVDAYLRDLLDAEEATVLQALLEESR